MHGGSIMQSSGKGKRGRVRYIVESLKRYIVTPSQRFNDSTIQRFNDSTI
jgi:hypothetical protein